MKQVIKMRKGLTLVEFIIVITILSVIFISAFPGTTDQIIGDNKDLKALTEVGQSINEEFKENYTDAIEDKQEIKKLKDEIVRLNDIIDKLKSKENTLTNSNEDIKLEKIFVPNDTLIGTGY